MYLCAMKYCVIIAFYKREEITRLCFQKLAEQRDRFKFFDVIVCGSEHDTSRLIAEDYGFEYVEHPNIPVSEKNNYLLQQTRGYDGVILLGSDDFLSDDQLLSYKELNTDVCAMYGFDTVIFYDVATKQAYKYKQTSYTVGAGRMFTHPLLERANYRLWNIVANKGLDRIALQTVLRYGQEVWIEGEVLDVKHELNITSHAVIENCEQIDNDYLRKFDIKGLNLLKEKSNKQIQIDMSGDKLQVKWLKDDAGMTVGTVKSLKSKLALQLVEMGVVELHIEHKGEVKPKRTRRATN